MTEHFIALDVHCAFSEMAVVTKGGKLVRRDRCETSIPALVERLKAIRRPRRLTFEEGPLADWLARELRSHVDELVVCEPRRNHWIARDGDKDDPVDSFKLAELYRGGYLKSVHQAGSLDRSLLKQQVLLYHDRVRDRVRQGNQLVGLCRRHGVFIKAHDLLEDEEWSRCLNTLPADSPLRCGWESVRETYLLLLTREEALRTSLVAAARNIEPVRRFAALPGFGWIRSVTFYAMVDTPHRFPARRLCGGMPGSVWNGGTAAAARYRPGCRDKDIESSKTSCWERRSRRSPSRTTRSPRSTRPGGRKGSIRPMHAGTWLVPSPRRYGACGRPDKRMSPK